MSFNAEGTSGAEHEALDALIQAVLAERADARAQKDWAKADAMRDLLASAGVGEGWREWFRAGALARG